MQSLTGNCIVGQSGGPSSVINSSLCGVLEQSLKSSKINKVYGAVNGIEGLLEKRIVDLGSIINTEENFHLLKSTPAAYLGSCRFKLPDLEGNKEMYDKIFGIFKEYDIAYFFYIGGNDSMDTVAKLSKYAEQISFPINILGVPKTIDNDLYGTDHTPGFGSAAKYIATTINEITRDMNVYNIDFVTIIEVMGRNAGWLTASAALARSNYNSTPDLIYLPEVPFSIEKFVEDVTRVQKEKKRVVAVVSEGIRDANGEYICDVINKDKPLDSFGHKSLGGTAAVLGEIIGDKLGCKIRHIELSLLQRCAAHSASKTDVDEAYMVGAEAVKAAEEGITGQMMIYVREPGKDYKITIDHVNIDKIANKEKKIPLEWINEEGNDVKPEIIDYMKPLIMGEPNLVVKDGIPLHIVLDTSSI
jgi:6-phosphofructokinase 1